MHYHAVQKSILVVMADETTQAAEQQSHEQVEEEAAQPRGTSLRARNFNLSAAGWYSGLAGDEPAGGFYARVFSEAREDAEVELINRAAHVLGANEVARWMNTRVPSLNGQTPLSLMGTEQGRKQVETVLGRIEHGIF